MNGQPDARMSGQELAADDGQKGLRIRRQADDLYMPQRVILDGRGGAHDVVQAGIRTLHLRMQFHGFLCRAQRAALAVEEPQSQRAFKRLQFAADGGLRRAQQDRRAGHAARGHHGVEYLNMSKAGRHGKTLGNISRSDGML
ncbi:hypothetical protein D3C85_1180540 [compost metagenome]